MLEAFSIDANPVHFVCSDFFKKKKLCRQPSSSSLHSCCPTAIDKFRLLVLRAFRAWSDTGLSIWQSLPRTSPPTLKSPATLASRPFSPSLLSFRRHPSSVASCRKWPIFFASAPSAEPLLSGPGNQLLAHKVSALHPTPPFLLASSHWLCCAALSRQKPGAGHTERELRGGGRKGGGRCRRPAVWHASIGALIYRRHPVRRVPLAHGSCAALPPVSQRPLSKNVG